MVRVAHFKLEGDKKTWTTRGAVAYSNSLRAIENKSGLKLADLCRRKRASVVSRLLHSLSLNFA